jgi:hypothetical protein
MPKNIIFVLLFVLLFINSQTSFGQGDKAEPQTELDSMNQANEAWDRLSVSFGGFLAGYNSGITIGSKNLGLGLVIDIEDALGLDVSNFATRGKVIYRFGKTKKHALAAGYFGINRNANKILKDSVQLGDIIYPIGTELTSKYNLSIIRLKYDYSFYQDKRVSLGASIGMFIMPVNFSVKAQGKEDQVTNFVAPLPLIGLRSDFQIGNKFYLRQTAELLYLSFTDFTGSLLDLTIMLEHKTFKNVGFGIGINSNRVNITIKDPESKFNFFGDIRMDYTGLLLYGRYFF